jgi:glycosyltransferase involved in cell wall biosynthesis
MALRDIDVDGYDRERSDPAALPAAPLVSVKIITYQQSAYIAQALDSVLSQDAPFPYEICLGEDGSTDGTREICQDYLARHPDRIRLLLRDRNNPARRRCREPYIHNSIATLRATRGKYVALLDGDDCWTSASKLRKQVECMEADDACSLCFHPVEVFDEATRQTRIQDVAELPLTADRLLERNFVHSCSLCMRNGFPADLFTWLEKMPMTDWPLCIVSALRGTIRCLPEVMARYRINATSSWARQGMHREPTLRVFRQMFELLPRERRPALYRGLIRHYAGWEHQERERGRRMAAWRNMVSARWYALLLRGSLLAQGRRAA